MKRKMIGKIQLTLGIILLLASLFSLLLVRGYFWDSNIPPGYAYYSEYQAEINNIYQLVFDAMNDGTITDQTERDRIYADYYSNQIANKSRYEIATMILIMGLIIETTLSLIMIFQGLSKFAKK